ncbi:MAG TPA: NnrU family protein [Terracidiphilus sp.]|nr:NnrU family protein [Terracidiphilus sp.]
MTKSLSVLYGAIAYVIFFLTFLYAIAFVGNFLVPRTVDAGLSSPTATAIIIDVILLGLFAVQHSIMARPWFKRWWTRIVAWGVERTTYVLLASLCLILLFWQWRPLPQVVWDVQSPAGRGVLTALFWIGWIIVLVSTFLIDHMELFGLRQVMAYAKGTEFVPPTFKERLFYKVCRHPIMLGFIVAFWATPTMTVGHMLFTVATTVYIVLAIQFEEHDLISAHGDTYRSYRRRTSMLVPLMKRSRS